MPEAHTLALLNFPSTDHVIERVDSGGNVARSNVAMLSALVKLFQRDPVDTNVRISLI